MALQSPYDSGLQISPNIQRVLVTGGEDANSIQLPTSSDGSTPPTPATVKFASIAAAGSGDNALVAAVVGKKIRVISVALSASAAVNAKFRSAAVDISGLFYFGSTGPALTLARNQNGWFETAAGAALNINLSGAVAVGGMLSYIEV